MEKNGAAVYASSSLSWPVSYVYDAHCPPLLSGCVPSLICTPSSAPSHVFLLESVSLGPGDWYYTPLLLWLPEQLPLSGVPQEFYGIYS